MTTKTKKDSSTPSNYYVTNAQLLEEIEKSKNQERCTERLVSYFQKIATNLATTMWYQNYVDRQACVNYAVAEAWRKWDKFDSDNFSNPFAFYTFMISNNMKEHFNQLMKGRDCSISIESLQTPKE